MCVFVHVCVRARACVYVSVEHISALGIFCSLSPSFGCKFLLDCLRFCIYINQK